MFRRRPASALAFGKFKPGCPRPPRGFEVEFGVSEAEPWRCDLSSVQRLLNHLRRYTQSAGSREKYLRTLGQFCRWARLDPDALVHLPKGRVERLVQSFADELAVKGRSKAYVNTVIKKLRTFFRVNGFVRGRELVLQTQFVPTRYRKAPEYIPTRREVHSMADAAGTRRNRAIILTLWSSGVRTSTLCALNYGDVAEELERGEPNIMVPVYPAMKERLPDACKGMIPYYTFMSAEAAEALRAYMRERVERYGRVQPADPLFASEWTLWPRDERNGRRLERRGVELAVKMAAKLAGITQWRHVTARCLRKAFESVLISQTLDGGRLDKSTQEFFMGHVLQGTQDVYYDKTKVDFHRNEYAKLDFSSGGTPNATVDKLIDVAELEHHLEGGWTFVAKVGDHMAVVRRSRRQNLVGGTVY